VKQTPVAPAELRMGFAQATDSFHYALVTLNPDGGWPERYELPGAIERFGWTASDGLPIWAWQCLDQGAHHGERVKLQDIIGSPLDLDKCTGL